MTPSEHTSVEPEALAEGGGHVARRAAETQHRILLARLVARAPGKARILVRLEIGEPHDDGFWREGGRDLGDALGQLRDVKRRGIRIR